MVHRFRQKQAWIQNEREKKFIKTVSKQDGKYLSPAQREERLLTLIEHKTLYIKQEKKQPSTEFNAIATAGGNTVFVSLHLSGSSK